MAHCIRQTTNGYDSNDLLTFFQVAIFHAQNVGPVNAGTNAVRTGNGNMKSSKWTGLPISKRITSLLYLNKVL